MQCLIKKVVLRLILIALSHITDTQRGVTRKKNGPPFNLSGPFTLFIFAIETPIES